MILFGKRHLILFVLIVLGITLASIPSESKLGLIYFDSYQYEKAFKYLNEVTLKDKDNVIALKKIKDYFILQGNIKKGLEVMKRLYALRPHNLEYLKNLEMLADWNERPELKLKYKEIRANIFSHSEKERTLILIEIAQGYRYLRNFKDADRIFEILYQMENKNAFELMINYYLSSKQALKAIKAIKKYESIFDEDKSQILKFNTYIYQSFGVLNKHRDAIAQALKIMGITDHQRGAYPDGIEKLTPSQVIKYLYYIEGIIIHFKKLNRIADVERLRTFLVTAIPSNNQFRLDLGEFYYRQGNKSKSIEVLEKLLFHKGLTREQLVDLSERFYDLHEKQKSIQTMELLVRRFPKNRGYWQKIGELYDEVGAKKKALDAFLMLLKLERAKNRSSMDSYFLDGPKFVLNGKRHLNPYIKKYKKLPSFNSNKRIKNVEKRIIDLLGDIGNIDEMIKVLSRLVDDSPNSPALLSALAQAYYGRGNFQKSKILFRRSLEIDPNQKMALEVLLGNDIREGNYKEGKRRLQYLEDHFGEISDDYMWELKEEIVFQLEGKKSSSYKNLCHEIVTKQQDSLEVGRLKAKCFKRLGDDEKAYSIMTRLVSKYPNNLSLQEDLAYEELDRKKLKRAKEHIDFLMLNSDKNPTELRRYYQELLRNENIQKSWILSNDDYRLTTSIFSFSYLNLDISKGFSKFRVGSGSNQYILGGETNTVFSYHELYISKQLNEKNSFQLMLGNTFGDKSIPASFGFKYQFTSSKQYLSVIYNHALPANQTQSLFSDKKAFERGINSYYEMNWTKQWGNSSSLDFLQANTSYDKGIVTRLRLGSDYRWLRNSCLQTGILVGYSGIKGSGTSLDQGYLRNSIPYYAMIKCNNQYLPSNTQQRWIYSIRVGLGGDLGRKINILKSNQYAAELSYLFDSYNKVKLYGEHYTQSLNSSRGVSSIIGVSAQFYIF